MAESKPESDNLSTDVVVPKQEEASRSNTKPESSTSTKTHLRLTHHLGDLFSAPPNAILIHACNTQGSWGSGIALAFRTQYPEAYKIYRSHCIRSHDPRFNPVPTGTCLLIPPCEVKSSSGKHWIACLFTSARYGRGKDGPTKILASTRSAMKDLLKQVKAEDTGEGRVGELRMCRINSGKFGVKWDRTVEVLQGIEVGDGERATAQAWSIEDE